MAKKRTKKAAKHIMLDLPTPERLRQDGGAVMEVVERTLSGVPCSTRYRAVVSCKLDWYFFRKVITNEMYEAGKIFSSAFFYAGKSKRTTPMYGEFIPSGRVDFDPYTDKTDAQKKLENAISILSQDETDVIWDVCGSDNYAGGGSRIRNLQTGLRALSVHFGISTQKSA